MLHSGFAFHSWLTPHATEKCIARAKVCRLPKFAELTDLQGDNEQEECSLNHAASVALPAAWYAASFLAQDL
jgi:hypothetical protein